MASQYPPPPGEDDDELFKTLREVFRDVWHILQAHGFHMDAKNDVELKQELAERLTALAWGGIRDADELRDEMIKIYAFGLPH